MGATPRRRSRRKKARRRKRRRARTFRRKKRHMDLRNRSLKRWYVAQKGGLRLGTMGQSPTEVGTDANIVRRYKELEKLRQRLAATKGAAGAKVRPQQRAAWRRQVSSLYGTLRLLLAQRRTQQQMRGAPALDAKLPSGDAKPVDLRKAILSLAKQVASASSKGPPAKGIKKAAKKPRKKAAKKPRKKAKKRGAPASPASGLDAIISEEEQRPAKEAKLSAQLSREMRELAEARAANEAAEAQEEGAGDDIPPAPETQEELQQPDTSDPSSPHYLPPSKPAAKAASKPAAKAAAKPAAKAGTRRKKKKKKKGTRRRQPPQLIGFRGISTGPPRIDLVPRGQRPRKGPRRTIPARGPPGPPSKEWKALQKQATSLQKERDAAQESLRAKAAEATAQSAQEKAAHARKVEALEVRTRALEESLLKARQAEAAAQRRRRREEASRARHLVSVGKQHREAQLLGEKRVETLEKELKAAQEKQSSAQETLRGKEEEIAALKAKEKKTAAWRGFAEKVGAKQAKENSERKKRVETLEKELKAAQEKQSSAQEALRRKEEELEALRAQKQAAAADRRREEASRARRLVSVGKRHRRAQLLGKWQGSAQKAQIQATRGEIAALKTQLAEAEERAKEADAAAKAAALPQLQASQQEKAEQAAEQAAADRIKIERELSKLKEELAAAKKQAEKGPGGSPGGLRVIPTSMSTPKQVVITLRVDGGKVTGYVNDRDMGNTAAETASGLHPALHGLSPQGSDKPRDESPPPVIGVPVQGQGGGCGAFCQRGGDAFTDNEEAWNLLLGEQSGELWDAGVAEYGGEVIATEQKRDAAQRKYPQKTDGPATPKAAPPKGPRTGAGPAPRVASLYGMS